MRPQNEIEACKRLCVKAQTMDGGAGVIALPTWQGSVIWSTGGGWDHVSVAPFKHRITPSWYDMCMIKDIFFSDEEAVIQIHPPKSQYVNNMPNCLHLWRYQGEQPLPPSVLTGIRRDQSVEEALNELMELFK